MPRYFVTYRWELWLIIGIPAVFAVIRMLSTPQIDIWLNDLVSSSITINAGYLVVAAPVNLLLLSVSYLRVRRLEREFLASLWRYSIAVAVIGIVSIISVTTTDPPVSQLDISLRGTLFTLLPHYLALLWFARQLSRISLTHAFFLVPFSPLDLFISITSRYVPIPGSLMDGISAMVAWTVDLQWLIDFPTLPGYVVVGFVGLIVMLIMVWLLGNFDRRGERFRKEAIIILVATLILSGSAMVTLGGLLRYLGEPYEAILPLLGFTVGSNSIGIVFNLVTLLVLFGSVYLLRVRQPKTLDATPVPADNC